MGTKLGISTAYHPETDRQTERENRTAIQVMRSVIGDAHEEWDKKLPMIQFAGASVDREVAGNDDVGRELATPFDVRVGTNVAVVSNPAVEELKERMEKLGEKRRRRWKEHRLGRRRMRIGADARRSSRSASRFYYRRTKSN